MRIIRKLLDRERDFGLVADGREGGDELRSV
jgi:hypothetical protein